MSKIFDNVADVVSYLGVPVSIPSDIPKDTTILCYGGGDEYPYLYKQSQDSLQYTNYIEGGGWWRDTDSKSLEEEVEWDVRNGYKFAYLRLTTKDNSDVFTLGRLLGVETNKGFIIGGLVSNAFADYIKPSYYVYTSESPHKLEDIHKVKFYISDTSDETVSFEDYVRMFYEG